MSDFDLERYVTEELGVQRDGSQGNWLRDELADFSGQLHTVSNWLCAIGMAVLALIVIGLLY